MPELSDAAGAEEQFRRAQILGFWAIAAGAIVFAVLASGTGRTAFGSFFPFLSAMALILLASKALSRRPFIVVHNAFFLQEIPLIAFFGGRDLGRREPRQISSFRRLGAGGSRRIAVSLGDGARFVVEAGGTDLKNRGFRELLIRYKDDLASVRGAELLGDLLGE